MTSVKRNKKRDRDANLPKPTMPIGRLAVGVVLLALAVGCSLVFADWWTCLPEGTQATYVGRQSCAQCHAQQTAQWTGSHHDLAMDVATDETVLGDFADAELSHYGIRSRMYRQDGRFMVRTEGPDGKMTDFEVKYVFGVEPLQQYMVEFDRPADMPSGEIARLQVLRISWDTKRRKWFYLSPPDVDESVERLSPNDDLHWTGIAQRWNNMCADCHSTNLQKNFDVATKTYHTTFSEIDVSCEACHGPGSIHVQLAASKSLFWDRRLGYGLAKLKDKDPKTEIQACAPCHSRRRIVHPDFRPGEDFYDYFSNELLLSTTYHADGQILDEVYVYGSYLQSKMYDKAVRCTDCHNPHTAQLKYSGNQVCTSCHQHPASKYDTPAHHHHRSGSPGASCVECHMPETTYMDVDPRRDHSLRVPRPDLSVELGTPNACTQCHLDDSKISSVKRAELKQYADWLSAARNGDEEIKQELARLDQWSHDHVKAWYGDTRQVEVHFAHALARARSSDPMDERSLIELATSRQWPAIVRATALLELSAADSSQSINAAITALKDADPQVRTAALSRMETAIATTSDLRSIVDQLIPLLNDPVRVVRTEAARVLASVPYQLMPQLTSGPQRKVFREALEQFKAGLMVNNDRAAAHMTVGILHENLSDNDAAVQAYTTAMEVEPTVTGPRTNLAALHDRLAQDADQRTRQAIARRDRQEMQRLAEIVVHHQTEAGRLRREELDLLARDARLAPLNAAIQYRYGLSLYLHEQQAQAEKYLRKAMALSPTTPDYVLALALLYQKQSRWQDAVRYAKQLVELEPRDPTYVQLLKEIQDQASAPAPVSR